MAGMLARHRRRWIVLAIAVVLVAVYVVVAFLYAATFRTQSDLCQVPPASASDTDYVAVQLVPSAVLAASERIEMQVVAQPAGSLIDDDGITITRDLNMLMTPVDGPQVTSLAAGSVISTSTASLYATGTVEEWPFDSYKTLLTTVAFTSEGTAREGIPTYVCVVGSVPGWNISADVVESSGNTIETANGIEDIPGVEITATRAASTIAFGIVLLGLLVTISALVLFVAIRVYTGRRRVEATLTSWIGAMLFATIPLRTFLPGSPPVGSWIDYLVVLWVIVGLVAGLIVYILAWNRWGVPAESSPKSRRSDPPQPHSTST